MRTSPPSRAFIADNTNHNHVTHNNNQQSDIFSRRILKKIFDTILKILMKKCTAY
jgi:hypothetical protein